MRKDLFLVGAGGHSKAVIDLIEIKNKFNIIGILNPKFKTLPIFFNYSILKVNDKIEKIYKIINRFFINLVKLKSAFFIIKLFELIKKNIQKLQIIQLPLAQVSNYLKLKEGTILMKVTIAKIIYNSIINTVLLNEQNVSEINNIGNNYEVIFSNVSFGNCEGNPTKKINSDLFEDQFN